MTTRTYSIKPPVFSWIDARRQLLEQTRSFVRSRGFFWTLWSFIACVSVMDAALVVVHAEWILLMEENPICRYFIRLDPNGLTYFLSAKLTGTIVVLAALRLIDLFMRQRVALITGSVATYQAGLLVYLTCWVP